MIYLIVLLLCDTNCIFSYFTLEYFTSHKKFDYFIGNDLKSASKCSGICSSTIFCKSSVKIVPLKNHWQKRISLIAKLEKQFCNFF